MQSFTYLGKVITPELPLDLDWERYTYCQTKTIPLIWDQSLKGEVIHNPDYPSFKDF